MPRKRRLRGDRLKPSQELYIGMAPNVRVRGGVRLEPEAYTRTSDNGTESTLSLPRFLVVMSRDGSSADTCPPPRWERDMETIACHPNDERADGPAAFLSSHVSTLLVLRKVTREGKKGQQMQYDFSMNAPSIDFDGSSPLRA